MAVERGQQQKEQDPEREQAPSEEQAGASDDAADRAVDAAVDGPDDGALEIDERRAKLERLRAEGVDPYPPVSLWNSRERIEHVIAAHDPAELAQGEHPEL